MHESAGLELFLPHHQRASKLRFLATQEHQVHNFAWPILQGKVVINFEIPQWDNKWALVQRAITAHNLCRRVTAMVGLGDGGIETRRLTNGLTAQVIVTRH